MAFQHATAVVAPEAKIGHDVEIGPFCVIGPGVALGDGCRLHNSVTVTGCTTVGPRNEFYPNCVIGSAPQDLKYRGEPTRVEIGDGNVFREMTTVHAGTEVAGGLTRIGNGNHFLVGVHIAHDVSIADKCVFANQVHFAGHVHVEDGCHVGGLAAFHHFVTVGRYAYVAGMARVTTDVPPFSKVAGYRARPRGINSVGLSRWGFSPETIRELKRTYFALFGRKAEEKGDPLLERLQRVESNDDLSAEQRHFCDSIRRSMSEGVYGRYLETLRQDSDADRRKHYGARPAAAEPTA